MEQHSIAEARDRLPELIDRALGGDEVVITHLGAPVIRLTPVQRKPRSLTAEVLDWLAAGREGRIDPNCDAGHLVGAMRDEEWRDPRTPERPDK